MRNFHRLTEATIKVNPKKCTFTTKKVKYLGYIIDCEGVRVDPDKVRVILDFPAPSCVMELKSFLGMVGYWRRWLKVFPL